MITRSCRRIAIVALPWFFASNALVAGPINFGNNAITFTAPTVFHDNGATATIVPNKPTLTKLADGLSVVDFSYTTTVDTIAKGETVALLYLTWSAARMGTLAKMSDILLTTSGNTNVTVTGTGDVSFSVFGALDSGTPKPPSPNGSLLYTTLVDAPATNKAVTWKDESNTWLGVAAGNRTLTLTSQIRWSGGVVGDKLTVSSEYILQAVPEPTSIVAACIGLLGVALFRRANRPNPRAARKITIGKIYAT